MHTTTFDHMLLAQRRRSRFAASRLWREWCFLRFAARRFVPRVALLAAALLAGGLLFQHFEPQKRFSLAQAMFNTWSLVFGQAPEDFPASRVLQAMFFLVPVLGITVIIESIVELSLLLRDRRRYERSWCTMMAASMSDHIVIVGFGKLGFRTFRLLRRLGEPVVVIERNGDNQFLDEVRRDGAPLLIGDARREALLADANVAAARSLVIATNDDLANLEVALDARALNPRLRVVLRMFDQNMADKIRDGFNIHIAMSQSALSAPAFATAALDPTIVNSFVVGGQLVVMQRWHVAPDSPLRGRSCGELAALHGVGVVERRSKAGEQRLFPPAEARFEEGDDLLVQGMFETIRKLRPQVSPPQQSVPVGK